MKWKHYLAGLVGFSLGFWALTPRDVVLLPRYEVLVEDASGKGFPSARVEQIRQDYVITSAITSSYASADPYGRSAFPLVAGHTSPLKRWIVCAQHKHASGMNAPCGYLNEITVDLPGYVEASRTDTALPLKSRGRLLLITMHAKP